MKRIFIIVLLLISLGGIFLLYERNRDLASPLLQLEAKLSQKPIASFPTNATDTNASGPQIIAQNLDTPWAIAFLPSGDLLVTERKGTVQLVSKEGSVIKLVGTISQVREIGEGGLLGIAVHPDFSANNLVYFYYTYSGTGDATVNRVVSMQFVNNQLTNETVLVDAIPGAANHNGGRISFGPDRLLYVATGDAQEPSLAQDTNSLAGKILRVTDQGKPAPGNPFSNEVYSYGHRNAQGLAWDAQRNLWATEHGRSGAQSGLDEINFIQPGKNYGWPEIQGTETRSGMETAERSSGNTTWAPAGAAFTNNSIFFGGLRGQTLYQALISGDQVTEVKEYFKGELGRIREVILGPDGLLYISTSNKDGRGSPKSGDDKIIRIDPTELES